MNEVEPQRHREHEIPVRDRGTTPAFANGRYPAGGAVNAGNLVLLSLAFLCASVSLWWGF